MRCPRWAERLLGLVPGERREPQVTPARQSGGRGCNPVRAARSPLARRRPAPAPRPPARSGASAARRSPRRRHLRFLLLPWLSPRDGSGRPERSLLPKRRLGGGGDDGCQGRGRAFPSPLHRPPPHVPKAESQAVSPANKTKQKPNSCSVGDSCLTASNAGAPLSKLCPTFDHLLKLETLVVLNGPG